MGFSYNISYRFLGLLVGKKEKSIKQYFWRNKIDKDNPEHVREYLKKNL